jgi:L-lysine exporter family protein LysE/ArgO
MALIQGFFLGAGLCASIGPQSLFVLRQGQRGEAALLVALICTIVDFGLIYAAISGAVAVADSLPGIAALSSWLAGGCVLAYGLISLRAGLRRPRPTQGDDPRGASGTAFAVALGALGVSLLNPQTYAEMMAAVAAGSLHCAPDDRWLFGLGVAAASPLWFFGLVVGGRRLASLLQRGGRCWNLDRIAGSIMVGLGAAMLAANMLR